MSSRPSSRSESTVIAMKLFVIEQMRKAVSASGAGAGLGVPNAAAARVDELAVERDAVGEAGRSELAERLGEERIDGGCGCAHACGALGIVEGGVHVAGS